jgi:uncharacterized membrane protein
MTVRIFKTWQEIRSSYWFVPAVMAGLAILLSFLTIYLDDQYKDDVVEQLGFLWTGGPEGARGLLETVAGSMITVAGVTFSIIMVALSLATSQFGSRLLRSFMADTGNQIVLGTFTSTFIYCLMVLRTVRSMDGDEFVPYISVTLALFFALASLGVLIYFIHHAAQMMQDQYVIGEVASDLLGTIDRLFPEGIGYDVQKDGEKQGEELPDHPEEQSDYVLAQKSGYLQAIENDTLMQMARDNDLVLSLPHRPGHFIVDGTPIAEVKPPGRLGKKNHQKLVRSFIIGNQRTHTQDIEFAIEQLVEVAIRSLSTGINDPFTALACIDWIGAGLSKIAGKDFPSPYRYDTFGNLRLFFERPITFEGITDASFNQIRQYSKDSVAVRMRLLETIASISQKTDKEEHLKVLSRHASMIENGVADENLQYEDRKGIEKRFWKAKKNIRKQ